MDFRKYFSSVSNGFSRFPQTVILEGGSPEDRRKASDVLAAASVCQKGDACGECNGCKRAMSHSHTEIIYISREKDKKTIPVSAARELRSKAFINPAEGNKKVFVIYDAETLGEEAQNALLKILEEPPEFDRFILCTENSSALLPTVRSRAAVWNLGDSGAADFDSKAGILAKKTARAIISGEEKDFVFLIPQYEKDRLVSSEALSLLAVIVRDALAKSYRAPVVSDEEESGGLSERFSCEKLMKIMRICTDAKQAIDSNIKIGLAAAVMFCDISALKDL